LVVEDGLGLNLNHNLIFALAAWSSGNVSFPATDEIGAIGREIESRQGICRVVVKNMIYVISNEM
jgi:hypothetical protein